MRHLLPAALALLLPACGGGTDAPLPTAKADPLAKPVADCLAAHPD